MPVLHNAITVAYCLIGFAAFGAIRPTNQVRLLRRLQSLRCSESGGRLWKDAEVDHRVPLFRVWSDYREAPISHVRFHFCCWGIKPTYRETWRSVEDGRVGMWRGGFRPNISVAASFVWRCLSGSTVTPSPHPAHRSGHADFPHPALGQDVTPSPTARRAQARSGERARSTRTGARVDRSRPCVA
jgi:hypothetical protein